MDKQKTTEHIAQEDRAKMIEHLKYPAFEGLVVEPDNPKLKVRIPKPGDDDYDPRCETARTFVEKGYNWQEQGRGAAS